MTSVSELARSDIKKIGLEKLNKKILSDPQMSLFAEQTLAEAEKAWDRMVIDFAENIIEISMSCHKILGCSGISRVDFILDGTGTPYVLEINTMPGMTSTSLVPMAADAAGISFDLLVEIILDSAKLKI